MPTLAPGTVIDRYVVRDEIGSGSMGDVLRGEDEDLKREVAIKILSERHRENKELRARFVREARAVAAISHPNVVQVFTTGTFDDRPYIAMELLKGVDLGSVIKNNGIMTSIQAARAILDSARGLEAAAAAGLIHRDVKPSNLVLIETGQVKVTDFGLAKPLDPSSEPALTAMGVVVGTPDYIAPEQARGDPIDERVDIYALGGTLYFLLTGTPPYRKGNPIDDKYLKVVARHLKDPVPSARTKNKAADRQLTKLGKQTMSKKPIERPGYPELIEELGTIIDRLERGGDSMALPSVSTSSRSVPEPTPFIGSASSEGRKSVQRGRASTGSLAQRMRRTSSIAPPDNDESAATLIRPSTQHPTPHRTYDESFGSLDMPRRSGWLVAVTVISILTFLTGLGLILFGPMPAKKGATPAVVLDGGSALAIDGAPDVPLPSAPEGMILVLRPSGKPWLFADARPVTYGDFAKLLPRIKKPTTKKRINQSPVTQVRYAYVVSYAQSAKKRLLTPEEWLAASSTEGFETTADLWEWVDDGTVGTQAQRSVRKKPDKLTLRRPSAHSDVTFRLAMDLE